MLTQAASLTSLPEVKIVRESKEGYCDTSGAVDLVFVSELDGVRFYVSKDVGDVAALLEEKREALRRFTVKVLQPLGALFNLNPRR
jgi:hypothetical protein